MFGGPANRRDRLEAGIARHDGRGGAVAEQRGRNDVGLARAVESECQRAQFDGDEQHRRARASCSQTRCDRKSGHAAGAA